MPLLLAPYNSAMKLGCGFNSYTQQICINNAVIKDNSEPATSADLRVLPGGRNAETSQSVNWSASFVDKASEVMESLNISGSLAIKVGLQGGGRGEGAYLNTDKMKESDINYLFQVRVINQRLLGKEVTKFNNIPNLPRGSFTDVYGDCFISGFLEGGDFNALLSMKLQNKKKDIMASGAIQAEFRAGAMTVDAQAKAKWEQSDLNSNSTTSISVSWTGGGSIRGNESGKEWTMASMQKVALTFPEKVAQYPQYTHAILTKYTSLRSYQELANKGTPLDYENAGVYTSSLLDAYMEYKLIWSEIAKMNRTVEQRLGEYKTRTKGMDEMADYAMEAQQDYSERIKAFYGPKNVPTTIFPPKAITGPASADPELLSIQQALVKVQTDLANAQHDLMVAKKKKSLVEAEDHSDHAPLKPNLLKAYPPTSIGFERARRDCRWEMIKIVREVDEVTKDPIVATDPNRIWVYLSPSVFRELLPEPEPPREPYTQEWVDKTRKEDLEALELKQTQVNETKKALTDTEKSLKDEQNTTTSLRSTLEQRNLAVIALQNQVSILQLTQDKVTEMKDQMASLGTTVSLALNASKDPDATAKLVSLQASLSSVSEVSDNVKRLREELGTGSIADISNNVKSLSDKLGNISIRPDISSSVKTQQDILAPIAEQRARRSGVMIPKSATTPTTLIARYNYTYPNIPGFLFALSEVRGSSDPTKKVPPSWFASTNAICSNDSAEIDVENAGWDDSRIDCLEYNWLTSPSGIIQNSGSCNFQWNIDDKEANAKATKSCQFTKPYNKPPKVAVWWTTFSWKDGGAIQNARVMASAQSITTTGFEVKIESFAGATHEGARIMWCAWDSDTDGIKVIHETKTWGTKDLSGNQASVKGKTEYWPLDFKGKTPKAILTGIVALDMDVSAYPLNLECKLIGDLGPNSMIRYGPDSSTRARWMECMYIAILED